MDVVGVATPLVRGVPQVSHGDQVVELSVQLKVQEREEKGEDGEGQIEVEDERGELQERRTCTWMTRDETQTSKSVTRCALAFMLRCCAFCACSCSLHLLMWFVSCLSSVLVSFFML